MYGVGDRVEYKTLTLKTQNTEIYSRTSSIYTAYGLILPTKAYRLIPIIETLKAS